MEGRSKIRTVAPICEIVTTIDQAQYRTGQGPGVDTVADHHMYRLGNLTAETRWPPFTASAAETEHDGQLFKIRCGGALTDRGCRHRNEPAARFATSPLTGAADPVEPDACHWLAYTAYLVADGIQ